MNVNGITERRTVNSGGGKGWLVKPGFAGELTEALKKAAFGKDNDVKRDSLDINEKITADTSEMSEQEYEAYIYRTIDKMCKNNDDRRDNWVILSGEGLGAMKSDPEYERWVLGEIYSAVNSVPPFMGSDVKIRRNIVIGASREECIFEAYASGDGVYEDGFSGPTKEELRRIEAVRKAEYAKYRKYARVLRENAIEKADMERDHIRGIYEDCLHIRKNVCAVLDEMDYFWVSKGK